MSRKLALPSVDRRQQILDAALVVFAEQGFEAATNKAIAERAGVNQGLIYFYFASKADVCFATFAYHTKLVLAQLDAAFAQAGDDRPAESLARLLKHIFLILSAQPASHLLRIMYQITASRTPQGELSHSEEWRTIGGLARHLNLRLQEYLEARMSQGEFTALNPSLVSHVLTRTLIATSSLRAQGGQSQPGLDQLAEAMAEIYCYGLLPRRE
jgi:AcrR family transcriptional regulator